MNYRQGDVITRKLAGDSVEVRNLLDAISKAQHKGRVMYDGMNVEVLSMIGEPIAWEPAPLDSTAPSLYAARNIEITLSFRVR